MRLLGAQEWVGFVLNHKDNAKIRHENNSGILAVPRPRSIKNPGNTPGKVYKPHYKAS